MLRLGSIILFIAIQFCAFAQEPSRGIKPYALEGARNHLNFLAPDSIVVMGQNTDGAAATHGLGKWLGFNMFYTDDSLCVRLGIDTLCVPRDTVGGGGSTDSSIMIVEDYEALKALITNANYVFVKDSLWGGYFFQDTVGTPDSALIVDGAGDREWHRIVEQNKYWLTWWINNDTTWEDEMQRAIDLISDRHGQYGTGTLYIPYVDTPLVSDTYTYWLDTTGLDPYDTLDTKDVKYCVELKSNIAIIIDERATLKLIDSLVVYGDSTNRVNMFIADSIQNVSITGGTIDGNASGQYQEAPGYSGNTWYGNVFQIYDTAEVWGSEYLSFRRMKIQNHSGNAFQFPGGARRVNLEHIHLSGLADSIEYAHYENWNEVDTGSYEGITHRDSTLFFYNHNGNEIVTPDWVVWSAQSPQPNVGANNFNLTVHSATYEGTRNNQSWTLGLGSAQDTTALYFAFEDHYQPLTNKSYHELHLIMRDSSGTTYRPWTWGFDKSTDHTTWSLQNYVQLFKIHDPGVVPSGNDGLYFSLSKVSGVETGLRMLGADASTGGGSDGIEMLVNTTSNQFDIKPFGSMPNTSGMYTNQFGFNYVNRLGIQTDWGTFLGSSGNPVYLFGGEALYGGVVRVSWQEAADSLLTKGLMDNWLLAASGTGGTESITDNETVTFADDVTTIATRATNTITYGVDTSYIATQFDIIDNGSLTGNLDTIFHVSSSGLIDTVVVMASGTSDHDFYEVGGTSPPDNIGDNIFKSPGTVHIGGIAAAAQTLQVTGTLRVTASDGTSNSIMGRDADGDVSSISDGVGLTLAANVLNFDGVLISGDAGSVTWTATGGILGGSAISTSGTGTNMTVNLNINELTEDAAAEGDEFLVYYDVGGGVHEKIDVNNLPYITAEVDGSTTNEIQTLTASGTTTTYGLDLSLGGGSVTLAEGTGLTIDRVGNTLTLNASGGGGGIYGGDGTTPADVDVTITDNINFDGVLFLDQSALEVGVNTTGPSHYLHIGQTADTKDGLFIESTTTADELATLNLRGRQDGTDGNSSAIYFSNFDDDAAETLTLANIKIDRSVGSDEDGILLVNTYLTNGTEQAHVTADAITGSTEVNGFRLNQTTTAATSATVSASQQCFYATTASPFTLTLLNADNYLGMPVYLYAPNASGVTITGGTGDTVVDESTDFNKPLTIIAFGANLWVVSN